MSLVKRVCQNRHILFFFWANVNEQMPNAKTFYSAVGIANSLIFLSAELKNSAELIFDFHQLI